MSTTTTTQVRVAQREENQPSPSAAPAQNGAALRQRVYSKSGIIRNPQEARKAIESARVNNFVTESHALFDQQEEERKNKYIPLSGDLSSAARWVGGDLSGGRWLFITYENAGGRINPITDGSVTPTTDRVSQPVSVLAEASNIDTAVGAAISFYDEINNPESGYNKGFFNAKLKVARLAAEFFNNLSLASLRTVSQVQMYHNTTQVQSAGSISDMIASIVMMVYFLLFTWEFGSKWKDSRALEEMMKKPDAKKQLLLASKVTPEILAEIHAAHAGYIEHLKNGNNAEALVSLQKLGMYLNVLLPENKGEPAFEDIKTIEDAIKLRKYVLEFVSGGANMLIEINQKGIVEEIDKAGSVTGPVQTIIADSHQMRSLAKKVIGLLAFGVGLMILSLIPAMQPYVVEISAIWLVFNMMSFALDFPDWMARLKQDDLKIGKWEERMAYGRFVLMLVSVGLAIYFGAQFGMPSDLTLASSIFMLSTNTALFAGTMWKIHKQKAKELQDEEKLPLVQQNLNLLPSI